MLKHFGLNKNDVVYFEHDLGAVKSAQSIGIESYHYDSSKKDLEGLKEFLDRNIYSKQPPRILTDAGLSMFVDTVKLRELPLPIIDIDMEKLIWHFDMPVWEKDGMDDWNLTPWEVIKRENGSAGHQKRAEKADLNYPVVATEYNKRLVLLDGVHRLVKAYLKGEKKIKVKIIPTEYLTLKEFQT
jgi:hypothetical protein